MIQNELSSLAGPIGSSAKTKEIWREILTTHNKLTDQVDGLDENLSKVLRRHEYEYMAAYNIHVKRKEQQLKKTIEELASEQNAEIKDIKIQKLETTVAKLRQDLSDQEKVKEKLRDDIKNWKKKFEQEKSELEFYQNSAKDSLNKNKLLKDAIGRLQHEYDELRSRHSQVEVELKFFKNLHKQIERAQLNSADDAEDHDSNTFMTRVSQDGPPSVSKGRNTERQQLASSNDAMSPIELPALQIKEPTSKQGGNATAESFASASAGVKSVGSSRNSKNRFFSSVHKRANSNALLREGPSTSRYRQGLIPTENLKFSQFLDILFNSGMTKGEIKQETQSYVQVLETNYTDKIRDLKLQVEKCKRQVTQAKTKSVSHTLEKNDLEQLFVRCVEDVRKEIIRRRLKAEVSARKKMGLGTSLAHQSQSRSLHKSISSLSEQTLEQGKEFEETLGKLAELAKGRVKFEEFTQVDRNHLLDLFVNNERTLLKVYEVLFPSPSFKQSQILANPSDLIKLNQTSNGAINFGDSLTQATGLGLSIDNTSDNLAPHVSPAQGDPANSSFALDDLQQDSQLVTARGSTIQHATQMSGGLMLNNLNQQSTTLPNIVPAITPAVRSDVNLMTRPNPNQPQISFSP